MKAVVLFESMYGNTRAVAEQIAEGLAEASYEVDLVPVGDAEPERLGVMDLLVVGGPTHAWGLSRPATRRSAADAAAKPDSGLTLEPNATGPGLREWLEHPSRVPTRIAVFDTRMQAPLGLSGSGGRRIARRLKQRGYETADGPKGFFVTKQNRLIDGELPRAREWGAQLARSGTVSATAPDSD